MKAPADVLELGRFLAQQLEVDEGVDTLSRWMAHHLAGLMAEAADAEGDRKKRLDGAVVELILQIWAHRRNFPEGSDPLAPYEKAAKTLATLRSGSTAFSGWSALALPSEAALALEIYELSSRLALLGLIDLMPDRRTKLPPAVENFLSSAETAFLIDIQGAYSAMSEYLVTKAPDTSRASPTLEGLETARSKILEKLQSSVGEMHQRFGSKKISPTEEA